MKRRSPLVPLIVVVVVIAAVLFGLSRVDSSKTPKRVEKIVPDNALAK